MASPRQVELEISGMTCASCAARVEQRLNRVDGAQATVNFATEKASIDFDGDLTSPTDLVAAVRAAGYDAKATPTVTSRRTVGRDPDLVALWRRWLISAILALPVVVISMISSLQFDRWQWLCLALATPVALWGAWPFHRAAWLNARHASATMDTLISLGTLAAFGWSLYALVLGDAGQRGMIMHASWRLESGTGTQTIYLEVATAVPVFLLAGRYFELRSKRRAGASIRSLLDLVPEEVHIVDGDGQEVAVPIDRLGVGERFSARPGELIATDGVVDSGSSAIDTSIITGESAPIEVGPGDAVVGGTINVGGYLVIRATRVGSDTSLARITQLVERAQSGKAPVQRLADRVSAVFVPSVVMIAAATLGGWLLTGHRAVDAFAAGVAVLIIACPCALGLATPTALLVGTGRGAQLGILIRGPEVLESTRAVDTIVLDKTGTVTTGHMSVVSIETDATTTGAQALRLVGALEERSEHPLGRAIARRAREDNDSLPDVASFSSQPGLGVCGVVDGLEVVAGRRALFDGAIDPSLDAVLARSERDGHTAIVGGWDGRGRAVFVVADAIKPTSESAISALRSLGMEPILLTGDNARTAHAVAVAVGIDDVRAEVLPEGKLEVIDSLQRAGRVVAMVGDGVNDAAALARADLGVSMGTGTDAAIEASDLTLVRGDLMAAADAIRLSRRTLRTIKANLFWAFAYNGAAIPLAAAGLLSPFIAGASMALSSVFVVSNSLRLRRFR
ncbi:MAG: copper-translocating P-type ATPase [Actinobacteria bacterium]|nr:MAG: copper-translocating P-type ATPase [Actinomycetota bacterium]